MGDALMSAVECVYRLKMEGPPVNAEGDLPFGCKFI